MIDRYTTTEDETYQYKHENESENESRNESETHSMTDGEITVHDSVAIRNSRTKEYRSLGCGFTSVNHVKDYCLGNDIEWVHNETEVLIEVEKS